MRHSDSRIACPQCNDGLVALPLQPDDREPRQRCLRCDRSFTLIPFPALHVSPQVARAQALVDEGDASCFFHATNQASAVCDDCGRFLCSVCAVNFAGETLCPSCIAARKNKNAGHITHQVTYDLLSLRFALLSFLLFALHMGILGIVVICLALYGLRKPPSLVRRGRWRFVVAIILASLQIASGAIILVKLLA